MLVSRPFSGIADTIRDGDGYRSSDRHKLPHLPDSRLVKKKILVAPTAIFPSSLLPSPPRPTNRYSKLTNGESSRSFNNHTSFGRKSPDARLLLRGRSQFAETRRHRSTAADLGRLFLVCPRPPGPSTLPKSAAPLLARAGRVPPMPASSRVGDHMDEDMSPRSGCLWRGAGWARAPRGRGELVGGGLPLVRSGLGASRRLVPRGFVKMI